MDIREYRRSWERLSKMDVTLKVNREMGRFWALWTSIRQDDFTFEIENAFATIANKFFEKNPRRTIVDAKKYRELLGKVTKTAKDNFHEQMITRPIENLMVWPEANDVKQIDYPNQFSDAPYKEWPTLKEQLDKMSLREIEKSFNQDQMF